MKRVLGLTALLLCLASSAHAITGVGPVWATKSGTFQSKPFNGDSVGVAAAIAYCGGNGTVQIGPGGENIGIALPIPAGVRVWRVQAGQVTPRIGPLSGPTSGQAIRFLDGVTFPLTLAGLQAACDEVEAVGGGEVHAPTGLNITLASTPLKLGNRVHLIFTSAYQSTPTFTANASTNVVAAIMPKDTTGGQQYFYVEHAYISGNRGSGGWIGAGILTKGIYVGSSIKDCLVRSCKGYGFKFDGGNSAPGLGQLLVTNNATADNGEDGWLFTGAIDHILALENTSEITAAAKAAFRVSGVTATTANSRHCFIGNHMESTTACDGFVIENSSGVLLLSTVYDGSGAGNNVIKVTGTTAGSDGAFGAAGNLFLNTNGNLATIIDDQSAAVTISNTQGRFVDIYRAPKAPDDRITGQVVGIQPARQRAALASAATLVLLKCGWSDADISGAVTITGITGNDCFLFQEICFWSSTTLQFTDGGNLNLNGNWVGNNTGGKDCLCGKWDGTNFNETHRSLN